MNSYNFLPGSNFCECFKRLSQALREIEIVALTLLDHSKLLSEAGLHYDLCQEFLFSNFLHHCLNAAITQTNCCFSVRLAFVGRFFGRRKSP